MWSWERKLTTRKALRAAAAVAVALGGGCATGGVGVSSTVARADSVAMDGAASVDSGEASGADTTEVQSDASQAPAPDANASEANAPDANAGTQAADGGTTAGPDAGGGSEDATTVATNDGPICDVKADWERYKACCDELNWNFKAGCMAWGPPMPASMAPLA